MKNRRILFMLFVALSVFFSLNNMSHAESKKSALLEKITFINYMKIYGSQIYVLWQHLGKE